MKPAIITVTNASSRFTTTQWIIAVVGVVIAIGCAIVLLSELIPSNLTPAHSLRTTEWAPMILDTASQAMRKIILTTTRLAAFEPPF